MMLLVDLGSSVMADQREAAGPTADEISMAVTAIRFDDSCIGSEPDAACPPINIYRVWVKDETCRSINPTERTSFNIKGELAFRCRFKSQNALASAKPKRQVWRSDGVILELNLHAVACDPKSGGAGDDKATISGCERHWRAVPSSSVRLTRPLPPTKPTLPSVKTPPETRHAQEDE